MASVKSEAKGPEVITYIGPRQHRIGDKIFFQDNGVNGTFATSKKNEQTLIESDQLYGNKIFKG